MRKLWSNMKKAISLVLVLLLFAVILPFSVSAASPRLDDGADLLTDEEERDLLYLLDTLSAERGVDYAVVTVNSMEGKTEEQYADDYYDTHGYREDGILLLIDMETRAYYESTAGDLIGYFMYRFDDLEDNFVGHLSNGDYYGAFVRFARNADSIVAEERAAEAYERLPVGEKLSYRLKNVPSSLFVVSGVIGLIISGVMTSKEKAKLTSVALRPNAAQYVRRDSMNLTTSKDTFLYSQVTRVRIESDSSSGGGRSGGGSHYSSGGSSHGGHGGHF